MIRTPATTMKGGQVLFVSHKANQRRQTHPGRTVEKSGKDDAGRSNGGASSYSQQATLKSLATDTKKCRQYPRANLRDDECGPGPWPLGELPEPVPGRLRSLPTSNLGLHLHPSQHHRVDCLN